MCGCGEARLVARRHHGPTGAGDRGCGDPRSRGRTLGGEIVTCDSTAVYRGIRHRHRQGADRGAARASRTIWSTSSTPTEVYSAARYARDAAAIIRDITAARPRADPRRRHRLLLPRARPRAVSRARRDDEALRAPARARRRSPRRRATAPHAPRVDPPSAARILPRDDEAARPRPRSVAADAACRSRRISPTPRSPIAEYDVIAIGVAPAARPTPPPRVARRVDAQFARGVVDEVRGCSRPAFRRTAHPFGGLVYRQVLEMLARRARRGGDARADRPREPAATPDAS